MKQCGKPNRLSDQLVKQIDTDKSQYNKYELDKDKPLQGIYNFLHTTSPTEHVENVLYNLSPVSLVEDVEPCSVATLYVAQLASRVSSQRKQ